jgi:hypothetical protein
MSLGSHTVVSKMRVEVAQEIRLLSKVRRNHDAALEWRLA